MTGHDSIPAPAQGLAGASRAELEERLRRVNLEITAAAGDRRRVLAGAARRLAAELAVRDGNRR